MSDMIKTDVIDVNIGEIWYADREYGCVRPRFYKVDRITDYYVFMKPIDGLHVHTNVSELKYGTNSPEYYIIPLPDDMEKFVEDNGTSIELRYNRSKSPAADFFYSDENGYRVCQNYHDSFKSKVYSITLTYFYNGEEVKETTYDLKEPGDYGGLLHKYSDGVAIYGCFD